MLLQCDHFSHRQLPVVDLDLILGQHSGRVTKHQYSMKSKVHPGCVAVPLAIRPGDLVYLYGDRNKSRSCDRYLVLSMDRSWCSFQKFTGTQLHHTSYRVRLADCYKVEGPDLALEISWRILLQMRMWTTLPHTALVPLRLLLRPHLLRSLLSLMTLPCPCLLYTHVMMMTLGLGTAPQEWACLRVHLLLCLDALGVSDVRRSIWRTLKFISELMFYRALQVCCVARWCLLLYCIVAVLLDFGWGGSLFVRKEVMPTKHL